MKTNLLTNMLAATVALFTALFALPQTAQAQTYYDLYIAGTRVTPENCNDLSVIAGVSGTVKYDPATKTLTLDNATINGDSERTGIFSRIGGLTVKLIGTNTVTAGGVKSAIEHTMWMTITGSGTLNAESTYHCSILVYKTSLTIDGCTVNTKGAYGITGVYDSPESLTIRNATITAEGSRGSICDLRILILEGCAITSPSGAVWNAERNAVCDASGNILKSKVTIEPVTAYDLWIAGKQVNSANCDDLTSIEGVSGTVIYDPATKTLTLDNADINGVNNKGIESSIDGLTVEISGTNEVRAFSTAIVHTKPMTITGRGFLKVKAIYEDIGIFVNQTDLIIDGCKVDANGIAGKNGSVATFTVKNATVTSEEGYGSIYDLKTLTLEGCAITQPAGAVWNPEKHAVCDASGNIITDKVTIAPVTNGIETVTADVSAGKRGVYNLQGVRLGESLDRLPAGVYIYNGKKIIKK